MSETEDAKKPGDPQIGDVDTPEKATDIRSRLIHAMDSERRKGLLSLGPVLALLTVFYLVPFLTLLVYSINTHGDVPMVEFDFTLEHFWRFFTPEALASGAFGDATYLRLLVKSVGMALVVTFVSLVISYPITYYIGQKAPERFKTALVMLVIIPFWTSYLIRTYAWIPILSENGLINGVVTSLGFEPVQLLFTNFATALGLVYVFVPFMILPMYASMDGLDPELVEAARDLGAGRIRVFREVIFPLTLPGAAAGSLFIFIKCAAAYITPTLLGGADGLLYTNVIVSQFREVFNWNFGAALSFILLLVIVSTLWVGTRMGVDLQSERTH